MVVVLPEVLWAVGIGDIVTVAVVVVAVVAVVVVS